MRTDGPKEQEVSSRDREDRLDEVVAGYLEEVARGRNPDRDDLLARHSDLRAELDEFFRSHDAFRGAIVVGGGVPDLAETPVLAPGERLGDYEITEEIARGGMGIVYRARHQASGRDVALKILHPRRLGSEADVRRFLTEADTAAQLDHPSIVPVYEVGAEKGRHFLSMKLLEGGDLRRRVGALATDPHKAASLLEKLARAVGFAHERGILHRDLKPANILFDLNGNPFVGDFGLAKRLDGAPGVTHTGEILGTPDYVAPELLSGVTGVATMATDVYGLGGILYEILAGTPAFSSDSNLDWINRIRWEEPKRLRAINPRVPRELETICFKCLEKDPTKRYRTAVALADDLSRFLRGDPITAQPLPLSARFRRWCRRNPAGAGVGATVLVAVVVVAAVLVVSVSRLQRERDAAREYFWQASVEGVRAARLAGRIGQRFESIPLLSRAAEVRSNVRVRSEAVGCLALVDLQLERTVDGGWDPLHCPPTPDPRFVRCALRASQEKIIVRRLDGSGDDLLIEDTGDLMRFSPEGEHLAVTALVGGRRRLHVWSLAQSQHPILRDPDLATADGFDFEARGGTLLAAHSDGKLVRHDLATGESAVALSGEDGLVAPGGVRVHSAGEFVAVFDAGRSVVQIWRLSDRKCVLQVPVPGLQSLAWHPRERVFAAGHSASISVWELETGALLSRMAGHTADVISLAFHPECWLLASTSFDRTLRLWNIDTGRELVCGSGFGFVLFGQDGRLAVLSEALDLCVWRCARGSERRELLHRCGLLQIGAVYFSQDDRYLASAGQNGVSVWELPAGRKVAQIAAGSVVFVAFEPTAESLVTWGARGLHRWSLPDGSPVDPDPWATLGASSGLPNEIARAGAATRDGKRLVLAAGVETSRAVVLDLVGDSPARWLDAPPGLAFVALEPDGRLVAGGTFHGTGVRIWDAESGAIFRDLPVEGSANVAFAPDGRTLAVTSTTELSLWDTQTWEKRLEVPRRFVSDLYGFAAFSPRGDLVAVSDILPPARLLDARNGHMVTELLFPQFRMTRALAYSSTGKYVALGTDDSRVQLWDLEAIRRGLAEIGLDW